MWEKRRKYVSDRFCGKTDCHLIDSCGLCFVWQHTSLTSLLLYFFALEKTKFPFFPSLDDLPSDCLFSEEGLRKKAGKISGLCGQGT